MIAGDGWPCLIVTCITVLALWRFVGTEWAALVALSLVWQIMLFRDPWRSIPPLPLGIVAPVERWWRVHCGCWVARRL